MASVVRNLCTYVHPELSGDAMVLAVVINGATFAVTLKGWTGTVWETEGGAGSTILAPLLSGAALFHRDGWNPMVQDGRVLRLLPGNVGKPDGTNAAQGLWIDRIDREYFDGIYDPTARFYGYAAHLAAPALTITNAVSGDGGSYAAGDQHYRYAYLYDRTQRSLWSDPERVTYPATGWRRLQFTITKASHNLRVTGLEIYRSATVDGAYALVQTVNFLRAADRRYKSGSTGRFGGRYFYIPGLSTYSFVTAHSYTINVDGAGAVTIDNPWDSPVEGLVAQATGHVLFRITSGADNWAADDWNEDWVLRDATLGVDVLTGSSGAYVGPNTVIVGEDLGVNSLGKGVVIWRTYASGSVSSVSNAGVDLAGGDLRVTTSAAHGLVEGDEVKHSGMSVGAYDGEYRVTQVYSATTYDITEAWGGTATGTWEQVLAERVISANQNRAVHYAGTGVSVSAAGEDAVQAWKVTKPDWGNYYAEASGDDVIYKVYDTNFADGEAHPLADETVIRMHGEFALMIGRRLWLANVVLDPAGEAEARVDLAGYSEIDQPDVLPLNNVLALSDGRGGAVTGLAALMEEPVFGLTYGVLLLGNYRLYPSDPTKWILRESAHQVGNLAARGMIAVAGVVYVVWGDGIYGLRPNNLAETDQTPTARLRITDAIRTVYLALTATQKAGIRSAYDPRHQEILWGLGSAVWAYNVETGEWREINTILAGDYAIFFQDENANVLALDTSAQSQEVRSFVIAEATTCLFKSGWTRLSAQRLVPVHTVAVVYKSASALSLKLYADYASTAKITKTLAVATTETCVFVRVGIRAMAVAVEVLDGVSGTGATEVYSVVVNPPLPGRRERPVALRVFRGAYPGYDPEDVPVGGGVDVENFWPINGKLERTHGAGVKIATSL